MLKIRAAYADSAALTARTNRKKRGNPALGGAAEAGVPQPTADPEPAIAIKDGDSGTDITVAGAVAEAKKESPSIGIVVRPHGGGKRLKREPPVSGHSLESNREAAAILKAMLNDERNEQLDPTASDSISASPPVGVRAYKQPLSTQATPETDFEGLNSLLAQPPDIKNASHRLLSLTRSTSRPVDNDEKMETDQKATLPAELCSSNAAQLRAQSMLQATYEGQSVADALSSGLVQLRRRKKKLNAAPTTLLLPGLGDGRSRNEYGKSLTAGAVESSSGVIDHARLGSDTAIFFGSDATSRPSATPPLPSDCDTQVVVPGGTSCDLPVLNNLQAASHIIPLDDEGTRFQVGDYVIDLSPDLPSLAAEHPARVWNQMLHSLGPKLQPIVKWDYQPCELEGLLVACLTLVLPPTHPAITRHPLFSILPANRYTREYMASVEALGGIRQWVGEPRKYKADAQNTTLVRCIAEEALAWVHAPVLEVARIDDDEEEEAQSPSEKPLTPELEEAENDSPAMLPSDSSRPIDQPEESTLNQLERLVEDLGKGSPTKATLDLKRDLKTGLYGARFVLVVNGMSVFDREVESVFETEEAAQAAVARRVLDDQLLPDVAALARSWKDTDSATERCVEDRETLSVADTVETVGAEAEEGEVDWQAQLKRFCSDSGLPPPKYGQELIRRADRTLFRGTIVLEEELFVSSILSPSLRHARQDVARVVFTETFGQKPCHFED